MAEIADRAVRSTPRSRGESDPRPQLKLIAGALDSAPPRGKGAPLVAPAAAPPVLSPSTDICGVSRGGWAAAAIVYVTLGAALGLAAWTATPPEPWPASPTVFKVVFEEPPAPPAAAPPAAPEPPSAAAVEAPPEPAVAEPEPEPTPPPPVALVEPTPQPLPKPPPAKPVPPRRHAAASPRHVAPTPRPPAPSPSADQQVAILTPPAPPAPILPPQPISGLASNRKPDYPMAAKERGQQGRVVLRVEVSPAGKPLGVTVRSTSGYPLLDKAALAAVEQWQFRPATQAGIAVAGAADVPVQFRLEE
jgi:periplasmic protein TonB